MKICLHSASSEAIRGQIFKHQLLVAPTWWAHAKYKYVHVRFLHMRAMPILAEMWHFENRCCKILAHILWEQQWHLSCWKHSSHFYFSLLGRPFILFPLALEVFLMLLSVSGKSAHLLHANHTSFSNLSFKLLLIHFMLILLSFSLHLKSELPLTVSFKCVYLFKFICVRMSKLVPPPFWSEKLILYSYWLNPCLHLHNTKPFMWIVHSRF